MLVWALKKQGRKSIIDQTCCEIFKYLRDLGYMYLHTHTHIFEFDVLDVEDIINRFRIWNQPNSTCKGKCHFRLNFSLLFSLT